MAFFCNSTLIYGAIAECSPMTVGRGWYRNRYNDTDLCATHYQQYKKQSATEAVNFEPTLKTWLNVSDQPVYGCHQQLRALDSGALTVSNEVMVNFDHFKTAVAYDLGLESTLSDGTLSKVLQEIGNNTHSSPETWWYDAVQFNNRETLGSRNFPTMMAWLPFYYHALSSTTVTELRAEQNLPPSVSSHEILFWQNLEDMSLAIACRIDKQRCVFMNMPATLNIVQLYLKLETPERNVECVVASLIRTIRFRIDCYSASGASPILITPAV